MNDKGVFVSTRKAREYFQVNEATLRKWADDGIIPSIRTPKGTRLYNMSRYIKENTKYENNINEQNEKTSLCYCRVSSAGQKEDLKRQIEYMQEKFPNHRIIYDIGSGINFKRKGLRTILELAMSKQLKEVVVSYRDRLCRFAFELLEWVFQYNGVKLVVLNANVEFSENSELAEDLLAIINVFNCRVNGKRKYKKETKEIESGENKKEENTSELDKESEIETIT